MRDARTRIKICGITRLEDGLAAARAGADAVGFVFWPGTPRRVDPRVARDILAALPPFITAVGLFVDPSEAEVRSVLDTVPLAALQFHGQEAPAFCRRFARPYLKALGVRAAMREAVLLEWAALYPDAAGWLFDAPPRGGLPGGTGHTFDWTALPRHLARPVVLSGGLDPGNVGAAIRTVRPWAVDVSSGVEAAGPDGKPMKGIKDAAKIAAFVREVRNADA
ncbi:MAG: phosphoribosylanthranilate isomerase [Casimicrobiaceae bacterium]